ncbi:response regulator transcription factor [Thiomicrospira sp. R3]|uniref:response regulator transcription factor n=1 Tax=Thiomicrospira sp. R3 TaxID=3035472 RepID=UPI00259B5086|nr:response regulator transcription factor [Thiomicrospira sp. R3]WFE67810.1 response regulator transcription factor [Thiomicrospira sp. R3]
MNILLVEDQLIISDSLVIILESKHYRVTAYDSAEAFLASESPINPFQLAILDISLPGIDGITLSKRLRAMNPNLGIIMLTMHKDLDRKLQSYEAGADLFLTKPVAAAELLAAIQSLAKRLQTEQPADNLSFDPIKQKVQLNSGVSEALSYKEARILRALVETEHQQLEYWELLELNNLDFDGKGRKQLEVIMSRLRQKLTRISAKPDCLLAVRKIGYKLTLGIKIRYY